MRVQAILPCRGRPEQTIRNVQRLLATAGNADWKLTCIGTESERELLISLSHLGVHTRCVLDRERLTYWQAMQYETDLSESDLICNLANDLLPGMHWLARGVAAYQEAFPEPDAYGLLGFNGDSHGVDHSCHFLIDRDLLTYLGGWPVWYDHNYGDTELCARTKALGFYAKAPWATLFHDHPYFGGQDDATYAEGRAKADKDHQLYEWRRVRNWPAINP